VGKDIGGRRFGRALERKNGLGDAANLSLTFEPRSRRYQARCGLHRRDATTAVRYDNRNGRFDVTDRLRSGFTDM